jgi:hypothetical protein
LIEWTAPTPRQQRGERKFGGFGIIFESSTGIVVTGAIFASIRYFCHATKVAFHGSEELLNPGCKLPQAAAAADFRVKAEMGSEDLPLPATSSTEPDWFPEARTCYEEALKALLDPGICFVVGGAFAVHAHTGIWRPTKDLDLLLTAGDLPHALHRLKSKGFVTFVKDPVWLAKASRGDYFVDLITGIGNASLGVDESWLERAVPETVLGLPCRVLNVEELIVSKIFVAYRERFDGADVVHLIRARGETLDWARLLRLTGSHWELLFWSLVLFAYVYPAHTGAVPEKIWDDLAGRFTHHIKKPNKDAPFRGSLVDPRMFAIDVNEWGERNLYKEYCKNHSWLIQADNPKGSRE